MIQDEGGGVLQIDSVRDQFTEKYPIFQNVFGTRFEAIPFNMQREVMQNFQLRLQKCIHFNRGHLANEV